MKGWEGRKRRHLWIGKWDGWGWSLNELSKSKATLQQQQKERIITLLGDLSCSMILFITTITQQGYAFAFSSFRANKQRSGSNE
jgi:hypothetical protein